MQSAKLKVNRLATFQMQPCRFFRLGIMRPLKVMIDQFVSEEILVSNDSCDYASPLVIKRMEELEWRLIIAKLICNCSLRPISFLINHLYFNVWMANNFLQQLTIYRVITNSICQKIAQKSRPSLLHGGYIAFWHVHLLSQLPQVNIKQGWRTRFYKIII